MSFTAMCPACGARLVAPDKVRGQKVRCNKCDERFIAQPAADSDADLPPARPAKSARGAGRSRRGAADEDEAPRRKKSASRRPADEDDDQDEAPARDADDEPPAKERKKRKKRPRSPALVPALLGLGSLGLVAAALAIYFTVGKEKPPEPAPPIDLPVLTESVMADPAAGTAGPGAKGAPAPKKDAAWVEYSPADNTFTAKFPKLPDRTAPTVQGPTGAVAANLYTADTTRAVAAVLVFELPGVGAGEPAAETALDRAAEVLTQRLTGAKQVGKKAVTHQGEPAREFGVDAPDGSGGTGRVFLANGRVYGLVYATKGSKPDAATVRTFFDEFKPQS